MCITRPPKFKRCSSSPGEKSKRSQPINLLWGSGHLAAQHTSGTTSLRGISKGPQRCCRRIRIVRQDLAEGSMQQYEPNQQRYSKAAQQQPAASQKIRQRTHFLTMKKNHSPNQIELPPQHFVAKAMTIQANAWQRVITSA